MAFSETVLAAWRRPRVVLRGLLRFLASAGTATVVIASSTAVLALATWMDWHYGFLLVHAGILVLLVGCWQTARQGIDATLSVFEGQRTSTAVTDRQEFTLAMQAASPHPNPLPKGEGTSGPHPNAFPKGEGTSGPHTGPLPEGEGTGVQTETIPFQPGPLNWNEYAGRSWFPWRVPHRDRGVLWERDSVKLEVLDYCRDAERELAPWMELRLARHDRAQKHDAAAWTPVRLGVREMPGGSASGRELYLGSRAAWRDRLAVVFRAASVEGEEEAFRQSRPEGPLGRLGQVVLFARGKKYPVLVDALREKAVPLGDSGLSIELGSFDPDHLLVQLLVRDAAAKGKPAGLLMLAASRTDFDVQDARYGVCGSYYFDGSRAPAEAAADGVSEAALAEAARPRINILQGRDEKLYYRVWREGTVETIDELPSDGRPVTVLEKSGDPVVFYVADFMPAAKPGARIHPRPFRKNAQGQEWARVRLTVDGRSKTFWLAPRAADVPAGERMGHVSVDGRTVVVTLAHEVVPLGFEVELVDFERRLDPGTSRPSSYSSRVNVFKRAEGGEENRETPPPESIARDVVIELNRPLTVVDPTTGRTYRMFQSSFSGPFTSGDGPFDALVGGRRKADELYQSVFTLALDPGRSWKYAGCLMILAGIVVMYYMKAYFFERRAKSGRESRE